MKGILVNREDRYDLRNESDGWDVIAFIVR